MVLRQGLTLVTPGAAIGSAGALAAVRVIASELYGVAPSDPLTFAGAIALLLAAEVPGGLDSGAPCDALRHE